MNDFRSLPKNKIFSSEIEINKSRFLGFSKFVSTPEEAKEFVNGIKQEYNDAKHVVYAYVVNGFQKSSDDGEPSGTAGRPVLEFLLHNGCNCVVLAVVRYFGGIKLGTGGLVRAYVGSAQKTLEGKCICYQKTKLFKVCCAYDEYKNFLSAIKNKKIKIIETKFLEKVEVLFACFEDFAFNGMEFVNEVFENYGGENDNN